MHRSVGYRLYIHICFTFMHGFEDSTRADIYLHIAWVNGINRELHGHLVSTRQQETKCPGKRAPIKSKMSLKGTKAAEQ